MNRLGILLLAACLLLLAPALHSQPLLLPTANRALLEPGGGGERYFVGTAGRPWQSGTFGCVRSDGWQIHEGLDIRCLKRDPRGEPTDVVAATADGIVAYASTRPALSNYGNYIILRHQIDGIEIYSLYAHLSQVRPGLAPGRPVRAGEAIGIMGRTSNTRQRISKDRAHLHFELDLLLNDRFAVWQRQHAPKQRNDHGAWNGQNLVGLDPAELLRAASSRTTPFSLLRILRQQTELCRVLVRTPSFPWIKRYPSLVLRNPAAEREGVAGYEVALNFNGVPFRVVPRAPSEFKGRAKFQLLSVNEAEAKARPGRRLVTYRRGTWELAPKGHDLLELLTF